RGHAHRDGRAGPRPGGVLVRPARGGPGGRPARLQQRPRLLRPGLRHLPRPGDPRRARLVAAGPGPRPDRTRGRSGSMTWYETEAGFALDPVERAIADIVAGRPVVVVDDENRENEGDLIFAA